MSAVQEATLGSRHVLITLVASGALLVALALPSEAASNLVQTKSVSGPHGRSGTVWRYADRTPSGGVANSVTVLANDADGPGGKCTETWVDYSTKPHLHFNPGVLVNCSGGKLTVKNVLTNVAPNVQGMGVVVCEVPNTSGSITRNSSNCTGNLSAMYLWSGKPYSKFQVNADQYPNGVNIWKV